MAPLTASPLPQPHATSASSDSVLVGHPIPPIDRIRIFSDLQWEHFVLEWADSLRSEYVRVDRCGGAGDKQGGGGAPPRLAFSKARSSDLQRRGTGSCDIRSRTEYARKGSASDHASGVQPRDPAHV